MSKTIYHGLRAGSTDAVKLPSIAFQNGYIKAALVNSGNVYIGSDTDVIADGTTDSAKMGYPLDAGESLDLRTPGNLSDYSFISDSSSDAVTYLIEDF